MKSARTQIPKIEKTLDINLQKLCGNWAKWSKNDFLSWLKFVENGKFAHFTKNFQSLFEEDDDDDDDDEESEEEKLQIEDFSMENWVKGFTTEQSLALKSLRLVGVKKKSDRLAIYKLVEMLKGTLMVCFCLLQWNSKIQTLLDSIG